MSNWVYVIHIPEHLEGSLFGKCPILKLPWPRARMVGRELWESPQTTFHNWLGEELRNLGTHKIILSLNRIEHSNIPDEEQNGWNTETYSASSMLRARMYRCWWIYMLFCNQYAFAFDLWIRQGWKSFQMRFGCQASYICISSLWDLKQLEEWLMDWPTSNH